MRKPYRVKIQQIPAQKLACNQVNNRTKKNPPAAQFNLSISPLTLPPDGLVTKGPKQHTITPRTSKPAPSRSNLSAAKLPMYFPPSSLTRRGSLKKSPRLGSQASTTPSAPKRRASQHHLNTFLTHSCTGGPYHPLVSQSGMCATVAARSDRPRRLQVAVMKRCCNNLVGCRIQRQPKVQRHATQQSGRMSACDLRMSQLTWSDRTGANRWRRIVVAWA
ncbi:hypothetical protein BKA66DRAFT_215501 [Pyrenochaeta sp. MPI-SDFR-AT-0127]|nr:hypothetical protein BKA66DRAFT_215501 [Pyrenochaeta sp. MPI-SDFR-AT-0127]